MTLPLKDATYALYFLFRLISCNIMNKNGLLISNNWRVSAYCGYFVILMELGFLSRVLD